MELNQRLWDLWQITEADRDPAVKVLTTLWGNILKDPNNGKFRDLNFSKIRLKFEKAKPAFYLFYSAGFGQSVDGSRLQFSLVDIKMLQTAHKGLLAKIANPDDPRLLPKSQKPKEPKAPKIKDKSFRDKYASSSVAKHAREEREAQIEIDRQHSSPTDMTDDNNNNNNNSNDNDIDMTNESKNNDNEDDGKKEDKVIDTRTEEEKSKDNADVKTALSGLDADDLDFLAQIQSSKETTVKLSMSELAGKTKEEKLAIFAGKQKQFRKEKTQAGRRAEIERERQRRDNVKLAKDAKLKREEQQRAMMANRKKREKQDDKMRKQNIRDKIKAEKERKRRLRDIEKKKKEEQAANTKQ